MPREIKFRAWDNTSKKIGGKRMLSWEQLLQYESEYGEGFFISEIILGQQKDLIPMEFTGLKDKNGKKEVYEGDILEAEGGIRGIVLFEDARYIVDFRKSGGNQVYALSERIAWGNGELMDKKIGDIYSNPELLRVSK